jgi:hypothetical protein
MVVGGCVKMMRVCEGMVYDIKLTNIRYTYESGWKNMGDLKCSMP